MCPETAKSPTRQALQKIQQQTGGTSIAAFLSKTAGTCQSAMLMCLAKPRHLPRGDMAVHRLTPGTGMLHCELGVFSEHEKALRILSLRHEAEHSTQSIANERHMVKKAKERIR